jgi:deazaflavin-dependent oxidoreductase (nitroreductase family)
VRNLSASKLGAKIFSVLLHPLDLLADKLSGGKTSLTELFAGEPIYILTTIGAKTGLERKVSLLGFARGERIALVASNWGKRQSPAWYHNLRENPDAKLTLHGETGYYKAREAIGWEREEAWRQATRVYPGYDNYKERNGGRQIPVMILEPTKE